MLQVNSSLTLIYAEIADNNQYKHLMKWRIIRICLYTDYAKSVKLQFSCYLNARSGLDSGLSSLGIKLFPYHMLRHFRNAM